MHRQRPYPVPEAGYGRRRQVGYGTNNAADATSLSNLGPSLWANIPQGNIQQAYNPQPAIPQAYNPQPFVPQAYHPQAHHPQVYIPQVHHPQAHHPQVYIPQAHHPQAHHPEAHHPEAHHPQAHHPEAHHPEAHHPEAHHQEAHHPQAYHPQAYHPQAYHPQAHHPQAYHPQAYHPQAHHLQAHHPQATILQEVSPQAGVPDPGAQQLGIQQPNIPQAKTPHAHVPQAAIPPPPVTFEEKLSYFRPVPDPRPEDAPRPGPGRKKKYQRFWAPLGASAELKMHYQSLQTCDERVNGAEKKLVESIELSQTEHLQKIVLRNMQKREDVWMQCERVEQGLVSVELDLDAAKNLVQLRHQKWEKERHVLDTRIGSLRMKYPSAVDDNGDVDKKQLTKKESDGLQTMRNWYNKKWQEFTNSLILLHDAINRTDGPGSANIITTGKIVHQLGCSVAWSLYVFPGDSPENITRRQQIADLAFYEQPLAEDHLNGQPENGQSAEHPHAELGHGAGLDQAAGVVAQPAQDQQQPQTQQDDVAEEDQKGLVSFSIEEAEAEIEAFNREEPIVFEESPQQLRDIEDAELLAPIAAYNRQHDQLQTQEAAVDEEMAGMHMTHEEGLGLIQDFYQDNQPGKPQQQLEEGSIGETVGEKPEQQQGQQASDSNNDEAESGGSTLSNGPKTGFRIPVDWFTMQEARKFAREDFEAWEQARGTQARAA